MISSATTPSFSYGTGASGKGTPATVYEIDGMTYLQLHSRDQEHLHCPVKNPKLGMTVYFYDLKASASFPYVVRKSQVNGVLCLERRTNSTFQPGVPYADQTAISYEELSLHRPIAAVRIEIIDGRPRAVNIREQQQAKIDAHGAELKAAQKRKVSEAKKMLSAPKVGTHELNQDRSTKPNLRFYGTTIDISGDAQTGLVANFENNLSR